MGNVDWFKSSWALAGSLLLAGACFSPDDNAELSGTSGTEGSSSTQDPSTSGGPTTSPTTTADTSATTSADTSTGVSSTGELRAIHAAPGVGPVDIYVAGEGAPVFAGLDYTDATDWVDAPVGSYALEFRPAGAAADSEAVYVSEPVTVVEGARLSAVAAGELGSKDEEAAFRLLAVADDWGASLAGMARARIVHAGPDAPTLAVQGVDTGGPVSRFETTDPAGFEIGTEGGGRLFLSDEGSMAELTSFTAPSLSEGDEVLLVATGRLGSLAREDQGFAIIAVGSEGLLRVLRQDPEVFVLHGSRGVGGLEACVGDTEGAANVEYGTIQSTRVSPGTYDIDSYTYPSGCSGTALNTNSTGALEPGQRYLLLLTGELEPEAQEAGFQLEAYQDVFTLDAPDDASLRFVHGASFTQIYVGSVVGAEIPPDNVYTGAIGWSDESDEVALMGGTYTLGIADADGKPAPPLTPIATAPYSVADGAREWVVVAGDPTPDGAGEEPLQAIVVDTTTPQWDVELVDIALGG